MPRKKQTEQEQMNDAFKKATGMKVVQKPTPDKGTTEFAKDTMKDVPPIQPNPSGK
jgi:hypothetical protein